MGLFSKPKDEPKQIEIYWLSEEDLHEYAGFPLGSTWSEIGTALDAEDTDADLLGALHDALAANGQDMIPVALVPQGDRVGVTLFETLVGYAPAKHAPALLKHMDANGVRKSMGDIRKDRAGGWTVHFWILDEHLA